MVAGLRILAWTGTMPEIQYISTVARVLQYIVHELPEDSGMDRRCADNKYRNSYADDFGMDRHSAEST
jgi:hypothetical protein